MKQFMLIMQVFPVVSDTFRIIHQIQDGTLTGDARKVAIQRMASSIAEIIPVVIDLIESMKKNTTAEVK